MARSVEAPVTRPGDRQESITTHPAFAQIQANRVSGQAALYGSDFLHHNYIVIRIRKSELRRDLSTDWFFDSVQGELIEVALSEAQWATFVSSLNAGGGVPCTLQHVDRVPVPGLPDPEARTEQFARELRRTQARAREELTALAEAIAATGLSTKKQQELLRRVEAAGRHMGANTEFVAQCFGEHMEDTVEKAKMEVSAYAMAVLQGRSPSIALDAPAAAPLPMLSGESPAS